MIVDDHDMVREGLKFLLSTAVDLDVVGEAANGQEALALVPLAKPDVVLMDIVMPVMDGAEATVRMRQAFPDVQVVALSNYAEGELVEQILDAGAISYLLKDARPEALAQAVRDARDGRGAIDSSALQSVIGRRDVGADLTEREREVLALVAQGLSNSEIAVRLTLSPGTVRLHVSNVLAKLGAPNRTTAAIMAIKNGLA
ncbi:MAG TPA: response regulator transcription factor [Thermoleophilia bacterium]|nr:response regulator transcription factor [Thermoleophilia bacterium]